MKNKHIDFVLLLLFGVGVAIAALLISSPSTASAYTSVFAWLVR